MDSKIAFLNQMMSESGKLTPFGALVLFRSGDCCVIGKDSRSQKVANEICAIFDEFKEAIKEEMKPEE